MPFADKTRPPYSASPQRSRSCALAYMSPEVPKADAHDGAIRYGAPLPEQHAGAAHPQRVQQALLQQRARTAGR